MSTLSARTSETESDSLWGRFDLLRLLAVGGVTVLLATPLSVLWYVSNVAGDPQTLALIVAGSLLAATLLARLLPVVPALVLTVGLLLGGGFLYVQTLPVGLELFAERNTVVADSISLLTGLSVLRIVNAGIWAQAAAPAPTFLTWYLALRRRYVAAVTVAGLTLSVFVLTGDAAIPTVLAGVLGGVAAVGFGDLSERGGDLRAAEAVAVVLAAVVVVSLTLSVVPAVAGIGSGGGGSGPIVGDGGGGGSTMEASLVDAGDNIAISGAIELSPEVRFTVQSTERSYWKVGSYDRYTGDGWVRTGNDREYDGPLRRPPGSSRSVVQTYEAKGRLNVMPAAWKPREIRSAPAPVRVSSEGGVQPAGPLVEGEGYTVESRVLSATPGELREAGTDYPEGLRERYTQLPANQPDRVAERTARITANAENPYDTARVVEQWLQNNRRYSLDVERPDGNTADAFLFEMEAGYCTYYATTMVSMLRSQDIPARLAVGYTPGEQVAQDEWVVRGLDSHAWVEVYFPDHGWVRFDPTPAGPREQAEQSRIDSARSGGEGGVDIDETRNSTWTPTPEAPEFDTPPNFSGSTPDLRARLSPGAGRNGSVGGNASGSPGADEDGGGIPMPDLSREQIGFGAVVLVGAAAAVHRSGYTDRAYRVVWLRYQPRSAPERDVERAYERLEYLLERQGPDRRPGQTPRGFFEGVDDVRARRVLELYERAHYAGRVDEAAADEAVELVDELVGERPWLR